MPGTVPSSRAASAVAAELGIDLKGVTFGGDASRTVGEVGKRAAGEFVNGRDVGALAGRHSAHLPHRLRSARLRQRGPRTQGHHRRRARRNPARRRALLGCLENGRTVQGINPFWRNAAQGALLVVAVVVQQRRSGERAGAARLTPRRASGCPPRAEVDRPTGVAVRPGGGKPERRAGR
ncbi:hypothetical protein [Kitasatospora sp. NPDC004272]